MALKKTEDITSIEVAGKYSNIQVKSEIIVTEDGKEIFNSDQRKVWFPDDDVSNEPDQVKNLAATSWTDEVKAKWDEINPRKITSWPGSDFPKKLDEDGNPLPDRENAHLLD